MLYKQRNFIQRTISIVLFTPLIILSLMWSPWTYFFLFCYIMLLSMLEFYKLIEKLQIHAIRIYSILLSLWLYTLAFAYHLQDGLSWLMAYSCIPITLIIYIIGLYKNNSPHPLLDIAFTFFGMFYIVMPFCCLHYLAFFSGTYSYQLILGLLIMIWSQDLGAYLIGSTLGKTKFFERISPKKTWEGFWGGVLCLAITSYIIAKNFSILEPWQWWAIGCITMLTGTYGDLFASLIKRNVDVKHSSKLIPGHGGLLDRMDSLLLTIPTVMAFLKSSVLLASI